MCPVPTMSTDESERLFRTYVRDGAIDDAFELLLGVSERLRGYLHLRFSPFLTVPALELVIVEAILRLIQDPPERNGHAPEELELALFRIGVETAQARVGKEWCAPDELSEAARARRARLEEEIALHPEPLRTVARLDLEHGGRASLGTLCEALQADAPRVLEWRRQARALLVDLTESGE